MLCGPVWDDEGRYLPQWENFVSYTAASPMFLSINLLSHFGGGKRVKCSIWKRSIMRLLFSPGGHGDKSLKGMEVKCMPREPRRPGLEKPNLYFFFFLEKGEHTERKGFYIGSNKLAGPEDCL